MKRRTFLRDSAGLAVGAMIPIDANYAGVTRAPQLGEDAASAAAGGMRERLSLDGGWRFNLGDIEVAGPRVNNETYDSTTAGAAGGAAGLEYEDAGW